MEGRFCFLSCWNKEVLWQILQIVGSMVILQRGSMVRAARALLSSVTRLLILADLADVYNLLRQLKIVQKSVVAVKESTNPEELVKNFMVSWFSL